MGMILYLRRAPRESLASLRTDPEALSDLLFGKAEGEVTDLDKAWHGLHYLFTSSDFDADDEPLGFLLVGGETVGDQGMGPIRAFTPEEVGAISQALEGLDAAELRRRFDPEEMTELSIYPGAIWTRDPAEDDTLDYLLAYFEQLKTFMRQAAQKGLGLLVYMS